MQLTDEQRTIIEADFEHCLITAVAGSGKTSTLAHRICFLLRQGHDPKRILVLMFNRAAKLDFERKLKKIANDAFQVLPEVRTYHAMGLRLYRRFIQEGYLKPYIGEVLTDHEIHFQLFNLIRRHAPEDIQDEIKRNKKEFIELAATLLDLSKTTLHPIEETFESLNYLPGHLFLIDIVKRFEAWRKSEARITFADMLYEPVTCLHDHPELVKLVSNKMDMILVDEYQDTNEIQHLLLKFIAGQRARVSVVGDPDQTIYEFRGAQPEFILNRFSEEFESPREYTLSYTFRYGHQVALLANHLITHNAGRKDVLCRSHPDTPATEVQYTKSRDDTSSLINDIKALDNAGYDLTNIAVLLRVWSQAVAIELAFLSRRIPYNIDAGKGALANREVNQVLALLELASGRILEYPVEVRQEFFVQLLRFPHIGLKESRLQTLASGLAHQEGHWSDFLLNSDQEDLHALQKRKIRTTAMAWQNLINGKQMAGRKISAYVKDSELFKSMTELALTHEVAEERIQHVIGMERYLNALKLPVSETLRHFDELKHRALTQQKSVGLTLTSMHQTKGLEWPCVMIPGLNEQYLPYTMRTQEDMGSHIQSERRLLYVAMTRAKEKLYLYGPGKDVGATDKEFQPSRFASNMNVQISLEAGKFLDKQKAEKNSPTDSFKPDARLTPIVKRYLEWHGIKNIEAASETIAEPELPVWHSISVRHAIFGPGTVLKDLGDAFEVEFAEGERMNFSKKSAHLYFVSLDDAGEQENSLLH